MKSFVTTEGKYYEAEHPLNPGDIEIERHENSPKEKSEVVLSSNSKIQLTPAHLWIVIAMACSIAATYFNNLQRISALETTVKELKVDGAQSREELKKALDRLVNRIDDVDSILYGKTVSVPPKNHSSP